MFAGAESKKEIFFGAYTIVENSGWVVRDKLATDTVRYRLNLPVSMQSFYTVNSIASK